MATRVNIITKTSGGAISASMKFEKSVYDIAKSGGYTGTKEELYTLLAKQGAENSAIRNLVSSLSNGTYEGVNLEVQFATEIAQYSSPWAWMSARIKTGNFTGLNIGDYIPFTLSAGTVAGYTINQQTFKAVIAGIDMYIHKGYIMPTSSDHHIDFITEELCDTRVAWNPANNNNGTSLQPCSWLASAIYAVLNGVNNYTTSAFGNVPHGADASAGGVLQLLPSELQNVIVNKKQALGFKYSATQLLQRPTQQNYAEMGKLWLPTECEIKGTFDLSDSRENELYNSYPIFRIEKNQIKFNSLGAEGSYWTCATYNDIAACVAGFAFSTLGCSYLRDFPICFRIG
jgi:hypothetical protein